MILSFKTKINGKPTNFVEKIWEGFLQKGIQFKAVEMKIGMEALPEDYKVKTHHPKLHTIRKDEKNRWKPGNLIDFFINARTKDMFRFAPRIKVLSTQQIKIFHQKNSLENSAFVYMDDKRMREKQIETLAINDGFESVESFFEYFNEDFTGKIIHWTDLKY
ncbi:hypothetical protein [Epilithonimonas sp. UC225_85]|uniref:hypothetical protein n=1 Tax=Epilithonimonas sp. UC225_85 TaxID=3350167 RepID=UPI0036D40630